MEINLSKSDREKVLEIIKKGNAAREINRAHVLNLFHKGYCPLEIADILDITARTAINVANNYLENGLEKALYDDPRPGKPIRFDARIKSKIVAIVCSDPPEGFDRWTLELLQDEVLKGGIVDSISKESIRIILHEHDLKPWQYKMWCVPKLDEEFIERMEDVLDIYERGYDEEYPVICIDEKAMMLHEEKYEPVEMKMGSVKKVDYEYIRKGTANVFCAVEPKAGVYINRVTENRIGEEFAKFIGCIEERYGKAKKIVLIMDNLNIHNEKSLVKYYGEERAKAIWDRFEVHYTPKHGSWLNQAEIGIGMYSRQCLGHTRIPDIEVLKKKTAAWEKIMNRKKVTINWKFTKKDAKEKFGYDGKN